MKSQKWLFFLMLLSSPAFAKTICFIAKENNQVIEQEGECATRYAPCSTFKIAISLMGYDDGLLVDETSPELPFKKGYSDFLPVWKTPHNPTLWMKNSCIWYSQYITQQLGLAKFNEYLEKLNYGNQDSTGDKDQNNGLTHSWLSSSLAISPEEQTIFLQKLLNNTLPVSIYAQDMTKKIMTSEALSDGWTLHWKTGSGSVLSPDRSQKLDLQTGWSVGWVQKDDRKIVFAHYIEDEEQQETFGGPRAKEAAKEKLMQIVQKEA